MKGILFSIIAGLCITLQGIFNSNMSTVLSGWHTTVVVHTVAFSLSLLIYSFVRDGNRRGLGAVHPVYFIGGTFGVPVVFSELTAIQLLGPAAAISILLVAQLLGAFVVESRGWFGQDKLPVERHQVMGIVLMIVGVLIFKW